MPDKKDYSTISVEIGQHIERLAALELQGAAMRQELGRLLMARSEIEHELGVMAPRKYLQLAGANNSRPAQSTIKKRESGQLREFWKAHVRQIGLPYKGTGPIPQQVREHFAKQ